MPTSLRPTLILLAQCCGLALVLMLLGHLLPEHTPWQSFLGIFSALLLLGFLHWRGALRQQQSTHSTQAALQALGIPLLMLDAQRKLLFANPAFLSLDAANRDSPWLEAFAPPWQQPLAQHFNQALAQGHSETAEVLLKPADNTDAMLLRLSASRVSGPDGRPCVLICAENLSAHNQKLSAVINREHGLRTRTQNYVQTLIDVIPQPVYVKDKEGRFVLVNQTFCARHNLSRKELIGSALQVLDADILRAEEALHEDLRVMAGTPIFREEHLRNEGQDLYFIISKQSCENPEGERVLVGTQVDITPWRSAEQAVKDALQRETERRERTQAFVQRLLDVFPNPVCLKDAQSRYVMVNDAFITSRGKRREELLNQDAVAIAHSVVNQHSGLQAIAADRAHASNAEDQAVLAGTPLRKEENLIPDQHGVLHDRIVTKTLCEDPEGQQLIVVSMFDITDMRNAQRELNHALDEETSRRERTEAFIQRLIDVIPSPVYVRDTEGRFSFINDAFVADRQRSREHILAHLAWQAGGEVEARVREEDARVVAGENIYKEEHSPHFDTGKERYHIISKRACIDTEGRTVIVGTNFDVTEWRLAERQLNATLERERGRSERIQAFVQRLLDVLPYPVSIKNRSSQYLIVNEAFAESRGRSKEEIISKTPEQVLDMIAPKNEELRASSSEHARISVEEDQAVLAGARIRKETSRVLGYNGQRRDLIVTKGACEDPDGQQVIIVSLFDITELREAQRELNAAFEAEKARSTRIQAFVQRLLNVIPEPVYVKDAQARYIMINEAFCAQRQQPAGEILGKSARELAPSPEIAAQVLAEDAEVIAGRVIYRIDDAPHPLTHEPRWRIISKGSCLDPEGQPVIVGSNIDVTKVRDVETRLAAALGKEQDLRQRTQSFIQDLLDALPIPICVRDQHSRHLQINAAFLEDARLSRDEIIGKTFSDFLSNPEQIEASVQEDLEVLEGRIIFEEKQDAGLKADTLRDLIISKRRCLDVDAQPVIVVAHIDVSAQREAERQAMALMNNEKSLRQRTQNYIQRLIDLLPTPFCVKDQESRYIMVNQAFLTELHLSAEDLLGKRTEEVTAEASRARLIIDEDQAVLAGKDIYEERHETAISGGEEWADRIIAKRRCLDVDGQPVIAVSHLDITAHRTIERELTIAMQREARQREKMGQFLQNVINVLPQEFYIKDTDSRVLMVNPAYLQRRGLKELSEAIGKTGPEIGWEFLERNPRLQADPDALAAARQQLLRTWAEARSEDLAVLEGQRILKKIVRQLPDGPEKHAVVIAKAACEDGDGHQVIVCASYDLSELEARTSTQGKTQ